MRESSKAGWTLYREPPGTAQFESTGYKNRKKRRRGLAAWKEAGLPTEDARFASPTPNQTGTGFWDPPYVPSPSPVVNLLAESSGKIGDEAPDSTPTSLTNDQQSEAYALTPEISHS